jgi:hypothetical protein
LFETNLVEYKHFQQKMDFLSALMAAVDHLTQYETSNGSTEDDALLSPNEGIKILEIWNGIQVILL